MKARHLIPFLLLLAACTCNKPMTDEQKAIVKEEGSAAVKEFFDAMTVNNAEAMIGSFENSADFNYVVAGEVYNYEKMLEMANQVIPLIERQTFDTRFEQYVIVDPGCFIYTWCGKNGMYMKSGEQVIMEDYLVTYCFRKHEEGWKLFVGHESEKVPLPIDTAQAE
jgi:hypothetical protein